MKANKRTIFIFTLLSMGTIACSSMEDKLVGEWQSNKPDSVHLTIAQDPSSPGRFNQNDDGFYHGFAWTEDGRTDNLWWRIRDGDQGAILDIAYNDNWPRRGFIPHKVIELTSDRFVVDLGVNDQKRVVAFQRVK